MNRRESLKVIGVTAAGAALSKATDAKAPIKWLPGMRDVDALRQEVSARKEECCERIVNGQPILRAMSEADRIFLKEQGTGIMWKVRCNDNALLDPDSHSYQPRYKNCYLAFRGAIVRHGEEWPRGERPKHVAGKIVDAIVKGGVDGFGDLFCQRGTPDDTLIHGIESFFITGPLSASRWVTDCKLADGILYPNDTYAGLSTAWGYYGGDVRTGRWPFGNTDWAAEFFSPVILRRSAFGDARSLLMSAWEATMVAERNGVTHLIAASDWTEIPKDAREFCGMKVVRRQLPANVLCYGVNINKVSYHTPQSRILDLDAEWNFSSEKAVGTGTVLGNFRFSPRHFFKVVG